MNEEPTKNLPSDSGTFEERVFAEFAKLNSRLTTLETRLTSLETRLTSLEEKVDSRLRDTRPMWEAMNAMLEDMSAQMKLLVADLFRTRARVENLEERQRPPAE